MKIKHLERYFKRYFIGIAMTAFIALLAGNAFGDAAAGVNATRDFSDGTNGAYANNYIVASPYWQVEDGASYTFVAVSHSSLSGMASQIGVVINAITSTGSAYDTAESFTVTAGGTQRVFIVPTNHSTINSTNISTAVFLSGTSDYTYGHLRITPQTSHPQLMTDAASLPHNGVTGSGTGLSDRNDGFRDSTMLSYWGSVIVEANTTGFAMEFIGDVNDSQTLSKDYLSTQPGGYMGASGVNVN